MGAPRATAAAARRRSRVRACPRARRMPSLAFVLPWLPRNPSPPPASTEQTRAPLPRPAAAPRCRAGARGRAIRAPLAATRCSSPACPGASRSRCRSPLLRAPRRALFVDFTSGAEVRVHPKLAFFLGQICVPSTHRFLISSAGSIAWLPAWSQIQRGFEMDPRFHIPRPKQARHGTRRRGSARTAHFVWGLIFVLIAAGRPRLCVTRRCERQLAEHEAARHGRLRALPRRRAGGDGARAVPVPRLGLRSAHSWVLHGAIPR